MQSTFITCVEPGRGYFYLLYAGLSVLVATAFKVCEVAKLVFFIGFWKLRNEKNYVCQDKFEVENPRHNP